MSVLFNFSEPITVAQTSTKAFGVNDANTCRVTSSFNFTSPKKAYSMVGGTVLLQQQSPNGPVNLILRPSNPSDLLVPVKYIIYRGLDTLQFLSTNDLSTASVLTSGIEIINEMQTIQTVRTGGSGDLIPLKALFGDPLTPANTKKIDTFFNPDDDLATSQLFTISGGIQIGEFIANADVGIDILLENAEYTPDVSMAKSSEYILSTSGLSNSLEIKWGKDQIRHFIDPAAFYGIHIGIKGGIEYRTAGGVSKIVASSNLEIYDNVIKHFDTKNTVYLDVRNENGYSYNYYDNYIGSGSNLTDELRTGPTSLTLGFKEYYSNGWPVFKVDGIEASTTLEENSFFFELRINDNQRPLISCTYPKIENVVVEDSGRKFVDETKLLPIPIPSVLPEFTETMEIKTPNVIDGTNGYQMAYFVKISYYKQSIPLSTSVKFPKINFSDFIFGPFDDTMPFGTSSDVQWVSKNHEVHLDALNDGHVIGQMNSSILNLDIPLKEIEIFDIIPVNEMAKVIIENSTVNNQNVGEYTIDSLSFTASTTKIKVKENIPSALQIGDTLTVSVYVEGEVDYTNNKFIVKNANHSAVSAFIAGEKLDFYSNYNFSNTYSISSTTFNAPNTEILFTTELTRIGYAGIVETGFILEADLNVGDSFDDERLMFYASPLGYFSKDGVKHGFGFANKGGASDLDSILDVLEKMMPNVTIKTTTIKPMGGGDINSFAYDSDSKAKEMIHLLGITKTEFNSVSLGSLSPHHIKMMKLKKVGERVLDTNGVAFFKFELVVAGLNTSDVYTEVNTGIYVYTTDHLIFASENFAVRYGIDQTAAGIILDDFMLNHTFGDLANFTLEEKNMLDKSTTLGMKDHALLAKDTVALAKVTQFKIALDSVAEDKASVIALLEQKGADLLQHCKTQIKIPSQPFTNKDGILYIARLLMQVIMKNHPMILAKHNSNIREFYNVFELHSRGLAGTEMPDFSGVAGGVKKILVTGFDPFQTDVDMDGDKSNPSGNILLSIADRELKDSGGTVKAVIKGAIFPVRWDDFDHGLPVPYPGPSKGIAEDFFERYFNSDQPDMIITYSYGVHYNKSIDHDFHLERFAANWQSYGGDNNEGKLYDNTPGPTSATYIKPEIKGVHDDWTYLKSTLPFEKLVNPSDPLNIKVGNNTHTTVNQGGRIRPKSDKSRWFHWDILGTRVSDGVKDVNLNSLVVLEPEDPTFFPKPFENDFAKLPSEFNLDTDNARFIQRYLVCDNTQIKYFHPLPPPNDGFVVPLPTWDNYKITSLDANPAYTDIRIEARYGSGGIYMSNLIFYRVAYMRESKLNPFPTGHIHMGFGNGVASDGAVFDPHGTHPDNRKWMVEDSLEMLKKFFSIT